MPAGFGHETKYLGITVKMLPWMEGVLMVPAEQDCEMMPRERGVSRG